MMKKIIPFNNVLEFNTDVKEITAISLEHEIKEYPDMISGTFYISGEYKITEGLLEKEKFNFELPFDIALTNNYRENTLLVDIDDFRYDLISDKKLKVNIDLYIDGETIELPEERNIYNEELPFNELQTDQLNLLDKNEITDKLIDLISKSDKENREKQEVLIQEKIEPEQTHIEEKKYEDNMKETEISKIKENIQTNNQNNEIKQEKHDYQEKETFNEEDEENNNEEIINPERIDLLKDMLTNDKENTMTEEKNKNINNNTNTNETINNNIFTPNQDEEKYVTYRVYKVTETDTIDTIITKYNVTKELLSDYNNIENIIPGDKLIIPTNQTNEK